MYFIILLKVASTTRNSIPPPPPPPTPVCISYYKHKIQVLCTSIEYRRYPDLCNTIIVVHIIEYHF